MGGFIKVDANRVETKALNTKVNKEVFDNFKVYCKELGYPLNIMLETFMQQYANGRFELSEEDVLKWKDGEFEVETLNTTFNKEIYNEFKYACKKNRFFIKHVVTAFMEKFASRKFILEYVNIEEVKEVEEE